MIYYYDLRFPNGAIQPIDTDQPIQRDQVIAINGKKYIAAGFTSELIPNTDTDGFMYSMKTVVRLEAI